MQILDAMHAIFGWQTQSTFARIALFHTTTYGVCVTSHTKYSYLLVFTWGMTMGQKFSNCWYHFHRPILYLCK